MAKGLSTVLIQVEASSAIGYGHYFRCKRITIKLQRKWPNIKIKWLTRSAFIEEREDTVPSCARKNLTIGNSNEKTSESYLTTIKEFNPELVIIDNYDVDCAWEREIKKTASEAKILVIDDSPSREHCADYIIDSNYYNDYEVIEREYKSRNSIDGVVTTLGPYVIPCYTRSRPRDRIKSILIYFGSQDIDGRMTDTAIEYTEEIVQGYNVKINAVFIGGDEFREKLVQKYPKYKIYGFVETLDPLIDEADLYIGACGSTIWDITHCALPAIVLPTVDNQELCTQRLAQQGLIIQISSISDIKSKMKCLISEKDLRYKKLGKNIIRNMNRMNDKICCERLITMLEGQFQ